MERYLKILGVGKKKPSFELLCQILRAHLSRIPFENISKLYYFKKKKFKNIAAITQYLDGIEKFNFGGTCYSNNFHLNGLLKFIGYNVDLCGADMKEKDVHLVNIVKIDHREYLVDVGNAAPFLKPIPRDLTVDYKISLGIDDYVLLPQDSKMRSKLEHYRSGKLCHGYEVNPKPKQIDDFRNVIEDSFNPESTFMNNILLVRFEDNFSQVIHNMELIESKGAQIKKTTFQTKEELIIAIEKYFGIPGNISNFALENIVLSQGVWNWYDR